MKKRIKRKPRNSQAAKTVSSPSSIAVEQDIAILLTTLVQKLASFETKIDAVLNRIMSQPLEATPKQPAAAPLTEQRRESRYIHKAICADCGRGCEVPFKPSGNRPVYCRDCFVRRKNTGTLKPREESKPKEAPSLSVRLPEKPVTDMAAKPPKQKKPTLKIKKKAVRKKNK